MNNALLLRLHRWTTLVFSLPLAAVIVTGLFLSFEPMLQGVSLQPGGLDAARLDTLIGRYDPDNKARGFTVDSYARQLNFQGGPTVDIDSGELAPSRSGLANFLIWSRRAHERLIGLNWLVTASTIAMLFLIVLGVAMGLPRLRNTLAGWHKGVAWLLLPLIALSPLTGLLLAFNVTFQGNVSAPRGRPMPLREAARLVAQSHDPARLQSLGLRGGRLLARLNENGGVKSYLVGPQGVTELPRNWPRLLHEGNWSNLIGSALNIIVSLALTTLFVTGITMWARRTFRRRQRRQVAMTENRPPREPQVGAAE